MVKTAMTGATHREESDASYGTSQLQFPATNPGGTENPTQQIMIHKLNGRNFLHWSQLVKLFIRGKGKLGYLTSTNKAPKSEDPVYQTWDSENSMVMVWLINSMEDLALGRTIGSACECEGLYHYDREVVQGQAAVAGSSQSYYTSPQGENSTEALSWKIPQSPFLVPKLPATSPVSTQISPSIPFVQSNPTIVRVHDRLSNAWEDKALPPTTQSTPQFKVWIILHSPSHSLLHVDPVPSDLDLPIALRKGVRSCTIHPISNFVSYHRLSSSFSAFTSHLSSIEIPKNVQETFGDPRWKAAVVEEVKALIKNGMWELVTLPKGKRIEM
ncbi:hypothetical protein CK203_028060 [Vitis vinifera]|uniref:Retrotransposon Copia-like N-terminal domain-containing protein n=1 Tax=Vitis vinifera TaxID=29760 RepID=A0A438ILR8_VITVI|nr:hypothetical protein CK203_028060 [Vitis vinifera]